MSTSYNISISLSGQTIFNGYFTVNNSTNIISAFYERVNGSLTTSIIGSDNNLLMPITTTNLNINSVVYNVRSGSAQTSDDGFPAYGNFIGTFKNTLNNDTLNMLGYSQDNAYINTWRQFDRYGVVLSNISYYQNTSSMTYAAINLRCILISGNDQVTTSLGQLYVRYLTNGGSASSYTLDVTYNITPYSAAPVPPVSTPIPISNICFTYNTPIETDQGEVEISCIDTNNKYTINSYPIIAITKTILNDPYVVCFEAHSIEQDYPTCKTTMSINHLILYKGTMRKALTFVNHETITLVDYKGDMMYNVLLPIHHHMKVNGMMCETLDPRNKIASFYSLLYDFPVEERGLVYQNLLKIYQDEYEIETTTSY
jgi:hypothetical protein